MNRTPGKEPKSVYGEKISHDCYHPANRYLTKAQPPSFPHLLPGTPSRRRPRDSALSSHVPGQGLGCALCPRGPRLPRALSQQQGQHRGAQQTCDSGLWGGPSTRVQYPKSAALRHRAPSRQWLPLEYFRALKWSRAPGLARFSLARRLREQLSTDSPSRAELSLQPEYPRARQRSLVVSKTAPPRALRLTRRAVRTGLRLGRALRLTRWAGRP